MSFWLWPPLVVVGLYLIYYLADRFWRFAKAASAVIETASNVLEQVAAALATLQQKLPHVMEWTFVWDRFPPKIKKQANTAQIQQIFQEHLANLHNARRWRVLDVILRLIGLVIGGCVFGGSFPIDLQRFQVLFNLPASQYTPLPALHLDLLGAILWLMVPALFGEVMLEMGGALPKGVGLFPRLPAFLRWALFVCSGFLLALSIYNTALFNAYGAVADGNLDPQATTELGINIIYLFGWIIAAASVLALYAIIMGLLAVTTTGIGLLYTLASLARLPFASLAELFSKMAQRLVSRWQVMPSGYPGGVQVFPETVFTPYVLANPEGTMSSKRNIVLLSLGSPTMALLIQTLTHLRSFAGQASRILAAGGVDIHDLIPVNSPGLNINGVTNITPTDEEVNQAKIGAKDDGQLFERLAVMISNKISQANVNHRPVTGTILIYTDLADLPAKEVAIRAIKRRLPEFRIVILTSIPTPGRGGSSLQSAYDLYRRLHWERQEYKDGVIEIVFLYDATSPFFEHNGQAAQELYLTRGLASLISAQDELNANSSFTQLIVELGKINRHVHEVQALQAQQQGGTAEPPAPIFGLSFDSAHVAMAPSRWSWWEKLVRRVRPSYRRSGVGDVGDIVQQVGAVNDRLLTEYASRGINIAPYLYLPFYVVYNIPLAPTHKLFRDCAGYLSKKLTSKYRLGRAVVVGNGGIPDPMQGSGLFCTGTCVYYLPDTDLLAPLQLPPAPQATSAHP